MNINEREITSVNGGSSYGKTVPNVPALALVLPMTSYGFEGDFGWMPEVDSLLHMARNSSLGSVAMDRINSEQFSQLRIMVDAAEITPAIDRTLGEIQVRDTVEVFEVLNNMRAVWND